MQGAMRTWRLGTRGSALALAQARMTREALLAIDPSLHIEIVIITTQGDVRTDVPLSAIGGRGVFAAELETALREGQVDFAVHSSKDLPSEAPPDMRLAAFLPREDPRDVLVSRVGRLAELPQGAIVGTSSPRRACQLRARRPDLDVRDIRGNVDTRLRKLDEGQYDAILLAAAGLNRLALAHRVTEVIEPEVMVPQVGQGAVAIEVRADDAATAALLAPLDHAATRLAVEAERGYLARLGAGCTAPTGAHATPDGDVLRMVAFIGTMDGRVVRAEHAGPAGDPPAVGRALAERLIAGEGGALLAEVGIRPRMPEQG
jgi:hydroxymethylbilane synthase